MNYNKKILLIHPNFFPEPTGIGKYNGEMMNWLAVNGFQCTVITSFPYYPQWKVQAPYTNRSFKTEIIKLNDTGASITVHRTPLFVPNVPTGKKRMMQDMSYWGSMIWKLMELKMTGKRFDLVISVSPPFHLAYMGMLLKKRKTGKLLYHIQDLQIDMAQELKMISNRKTLDIMFKIEKDIMKKANFLSCISDGMISKIKTKIEKDVFYFPNWVDTSMFFPIASRRELKSKWGYKKDEILFIYSGSIGEKQGLEIVIEVAQNLLHKPHLKFIICGDGPHKAHLVKLANEKKLPNLAFLPIQEKEVFNEFLNLADFHLVIQKDNINDMVMPSKLSAILAVGGVSIITTSPTSSLSNFANKYDVCYCVDAENASSLTELITSIESNDVSVIKSANARSYAAQHLDIDIVMKNLLKYVFGPVNNVSVEPKVESGLMVDNQTPGVVPCS